MIDRDNLDLDGPNSDSFKTLLQCTKDGLGIAKGAADEQFLEQAEE